MQFNITQRDKRALLLMYYNRYVKTGQLAEIIYSHREDGREIKNSEEITRRRMRKLLSKGLIAEYVLYANQDKIFTLDEIGHNYVCGLLGTKEEFRKEKAVNLGLMEHSLEINDFYAALIRYAEAGQSEVRYFRVERHNRRSFTIGNDKYTFQPDAFFVYTDGKKSKAYYVELDRSTEAPKKFAKKVIAYEAFYKSEVLKEDWNPGRIYPDIVVLCDNEQRIKALSSAVSSKLNWKFILKYDLGRLLNV